MNEQIKINWYRTKVDKKVMSELMKTSDFRGFCQVIPQLALFLVTGTLAYMAYLNIHVTNWMWSVPLLIVALFVHGTFSSFLGLAGAGHELSHKTPFKTKSWNEFFLKVYGFLSWTDCVGFRPSHVKHHQVTVHDVHDGEVVLPQTIDWQSIKYYAYAFGFNPPAMFRTIRSWYRASKGDIKERGEWMDKKVMPETNVALRRENRRWARMVFYGQMAIALTFLLTGHWFLIVVFNLGTFYFPWFTMLCGTPQHLGMTPNVPDFRLCCRTYTCGWLPAFLYWNMQYHVEHHMFPAVPFYNLPKLRAAIEHDLPPATHGLWATWKEMLQVVKKQKEDPTYSFMPKLPESGAGERATDTTLELEAAGKAA